MIKGSDRYAIFVIGLLLAAGIFYLALPQSISAFKSLNGVRALSDMNSGNEQGTEELRRLALSRADALVWGANPVYARDLAGAYHALSRVVAPESRLAALTAAHDASVAELKTRPLNAIAWWRLGVMHAAIKSRPEARSATYLWHSVRVQPNALTLTAIRLNTISDHWWRFEATQRRDIHPQFAAAWERDPKAVLRLAEVPLRRAVVRAGLATEPRLLGAFEQALSEKP